MAKTNITQYSSTPSSNTDINSINIDENCPASGLNNAIRELMAHLKNVDTGSQALTALSVAGSVTATTSLKTPLIEFTDGDNALTIADGGNVTANADLTVSGAFTSQGIDDNADATAITIDSSERVGINVTPTAQFGHSILQVGNQATLGANKALSSTGQTYLTHNRYYDTGGTLQVYNTSSANEGALLQMVDGQLRFSNSSATTGTPTVNRRFTIDANGRMTISSDGQATYSTIASFEVRGQNAPLAKINHTQNADEVALQMRHDYARTSGQTATMIQFLNNGGAERGTIKTSDTATSFNTSSDHRLKENVTSDWDATTRLKQLNPVRFNFISDADTTVDGFLAHEVQSVVPEATTGTYNEVKVWREHEELPDGVSVGDNKLDEDGNTIPVYQGIDQSKLVPLLVKTIQELEARITALENA